MVTGIIVGVILWTLLFVPVATFIIQPMSDSFRNSMTPNQYVYSLVTNFEGLYPVIIMGSLAFHIIYGVLLGYISGRLMELKTFSAVRMNYWLENISSLHHVVSRIRFILRGISDIKSPFFTFYDKGLRIESNVNKIFVSPILVLLKGQQ